MPRPKPPYNCRKVFPDQPQLRVLAEGAEAMRWDSRLDYVQKGLLASALGSLGRRNKE